MQLDMKYDHRSSSSEKAYLDAQPEEMQAFLGRLNVIHMADDAHDVVFIPKPKRSPLLPSFHDCGGRFRCSLWE